MTKQDIVAALFLRRREPPAEKRREEVAAENVFEVDVETTLQSLQRDCLEVHHGQNDRNVPAFAHRKARRRPLEFL